MTEAELQEVVLVEPEEKSEEAPEDNPKLEKFTAGVNWMSIGGGMLGGFATGFIPKLLKWDTGIKDVITAGATTLLGGYLLSKWNKQMAYGFVTVGGVIVAVKAIRMALGKDSGLFGIGEEDLIYDVGDYGYDDYYSDVGADVFDKSELFGVGEDPIIPTAGFDF